MRGIKGEEKLTAVFGRWPSFHDAEVWSLTYDRTAKGFAVVAVIHVFRMTPEVDARGYYKLADHTRVTVRFDDCADVRFEDFQHQNVLSSLEISEADGAPSAPFFVVSFNSSFGLEGELKCRSIEVVTAEPWIPPEGVYAQK